MSAIRRAVQPASSAAYRAVSSSAAAAAPSLRTLSPATTTTTTTLCRPPTPSTSSVAATTVPYLTLAPAAKIAAARAYSSMINQTIITPTTITSRPSSTTTKTTNTRTQVTAAATTTANSSSTRSVSSISSSNASRLRRIVAPLPYATASYVPNRSLNLQGFVDRIKKERQHFRDFWASREPKPVGAPKKVRHRGAAYVSTTRTPTTAKTTEHGWNFQSGNDKLAEERKKLQADVDKAAAGEEEGPVVASDGKFYAPVTVEATKTEYEKRAEAIQTLLRNSRAADAARSVRRTYQHSDAFGIKQLREFTYAVQDKVADYRESFETSQHPMVHRIRDIADKATSETEMGYSLGRLMDGAPDWDRFGFVDSIASDLVPMMVRAFLLPDVPLLKRLTEENAARYVFNTVIAREKNDEVWCPEFVECKEVELSDAKWINDEPYLICTWIQPQIYYTTKSNGAHVAGSPSEFRNFQYEMVIRRDLESTEFDWKVVGFQSRMIKLGLAA